MADEIKKIITIEAGNSGRTLRELQQNLDLARVKLMGLDGATEEYQQQLVKVKAAQADYNKELRMAVKENDAAKGSYNDLLNQLNRLKEQWKATGDAAERARLTQQINGVKGQLNELDHSIGNYQRNVGNYWGALSRGINAVKGAFATLAVGLVAMRGAWKTFTDAMQSTQSTGDALRNTINAIKGSYDSLMTAVVAGDWSAFSGGFWAVYDAARAASDAIDQLGNSQLAYDYLTATNQTAFNRQYNIWKDKASTEEQKKAAEEQMREIIDAQFEYARGYNKTALDAFRKQVVKEAGAANLTIARVTTEQFRQAMLIDVSGDPAKGRAENERQYREYLRRLREYGKNNIAAQDALKAQYADVIAIHAMLQLMKDDELKGLSQILTGMERAEQAAQQMQRRMLRAGGSAAGAGGSTTTAATGKEPKAVNYSLAVSEDTLLFSEEVGYEKDAADELARIQKAAADFRKQMQDKELADLREYGEAYIRTEEYRSKRERELLEADMKEREYKAQVEKQIEQKRVQAIQQSANAISSVMGSVASAYQAYLTQRVEGGKMSQEAAEREFESVKALQYAQTWINALAGAVSVWAGEGTNATKAIQSAAVLAQGVAATMQIANTTLGSVSSAARAMTSAAVAAPVVINAMPQVQALTSASQEEVLNERQKAQRVYVVYSDIAQAGKKVAVTQGESRF